MTDRPDDPATGSIVRLPPAVLKRLSELSPARSLFHIVLEWVLIAAAIGLCEATKSWVVYVVAVAFIGARQHALGILMHDGAHWRLFPSRKMNDAITNVLVAWPLLATVETYRANHFAHHRFVNSERDPDWMRKQTPYWKFPKSKAGVALMLLKEGSGLGFIQMLLDFREMSRNQKKESRPSGSRAAAVARLALYVAIIGCVAWAGALKGLLLYWVVPFVTWFLVAQHIRSVAEHLALPPHIPPELRSRTVLTSWVDRIFVASKNVNYHEAHHEYPSVPFFRLPELHEELMAISTYRSAVHVTPNGYWGLLQECSRVWPNPTSARPS